MQIEDYIFGKNAVLETLKQGKRTVNKILLQKGLHTDSKIEEIINIAKKRTTPQIGVALFLTNNIQLIPHYYALQH